MSKNWFDTRSAQPKNPPLYGAPSDQLYRSKSESIRKQALDGITHCAWNDYTRELLMEANAADVLKLQEAYIYDFCSESVQIASRMALTCIQEGRLFGLVKRFELSKDATVMDFIR